MKFKVVVKLAVNEMLSLKENWLIASGDKTPNQKLMNRFIEAVLIMLNPIVPHFCQHVWETFVMPAFKICNQPTADLLMH